MSVICVLIHRALYYQRRWVKLDVDYLRYFDNDKVKTHAQQQLPVIQYKHMDTVMVSYSQTVYKLNVRCGSTIFNTELLVCGTL